MSAYHNDGGLIRKA